MHIYIFIDLYIACIYQYTYDNTYIFILYIFIHVIFSHLIFLILVVLYPSCDRQHSKFSSGKISDMNTVKGVNELRIQCNRWFLNMSKMFSMTREW